MHNWLKGAAIALVSVAGTLAISQMMRGPVEGRAPEVKLLRTADGKPDLNGICRPSVRRTGISRIIRRGRDRCSNLAPSWRFPRA